MDLEQEIESGPHLIEVREPDHHYEMASLSHASVPASETNVYFQRVKRVRRINESMVNDKSSPLSPVVSEK